MPPVPGRSVTSKVLAILAAFEDSTGPMTLTQLAEAADIPLPTAHRLVAELVQWGALERDDHGRCKFLGYVAHADAVSVDNPPSSMTILGSSKACPVHLARFKTNIYGTQHHPEIDREGIAIRVAHYVGVYFTEEEHPEVLRAVQSVHVDSSLITHFVRKYGV